MGPLFKADRSVITDLVELVQLTEGPNAARASVGKYLGKLGKPCPTPGCLHELTPEPFLCKGYRFRRYLFRLTGEELRSVRSNGYALSTHEMCGVLRKSVFVEKEACRECEADPRMYREAIDGLFCQGCGFFIDYDNREVGYAQEWTTSRNLKLPRDLLGQKVCTACGRSVVSVKFADYFFCSHECLDGWLANPSKTQNEIPW